MVAVHPLPYHPPPLPEDLRRKLDDGVPLSAAEAAVVRASMTDEEIADTEAFFGCPVEALWMDSGVAWEDERAFLLGQGPDPWRR